MADIRNIQRLGEQLVILMSDGSKVKAVPTPSGAFWVPEHKGSGPGPDPDPEPGDWVHPAGGPMPWSTYDDPLPGGGWGSHHYGAIDMPMSTGTPLKAATAGKIIYAGWEAGGGGNVVIIQPTGKPEGITYAHMDTISVSVGATVTAGQVVGTSGATGNVTGPHLHLEVRQNGTQWGPWFPAYQYFAGHGIDLGPQI